MGKNQFPIEIFVCKCKFKSFLRKFQSPLVFSPKTQRFALGFLITIRFIKSFHYTTRLALTFLKIIHTSKEITQNWCKFPKILEVSIDFSSKFLSNSLASGGSAHRKPKMHISKIFKIFAQIFAKSLIKIRKDFGKIANFLPKLSITVNFSLIF